MITLATANFAHGAALLNVRLHGVHGLLCLYVYHATNNALKQKKYVLLNVLTVIYPLHSRSLDKH